MLHMILKEDIRISNLNNNKAALSLCYTSFTANKKNTEKNQAVLK